MSTPNPSAPSAAELIPLAPAPAAAEPSACCGATEQATCCAPSDKAACCGASPASTCGCRS
ncbi:MAG TPA: hypothetical protein VGE07_07080 [Herpetosiphonaceae bacterium]